MTRSLEVPSGAAAGGLAGKLGAAGKRRIRFDPPLAGRSRWRARRSWATSAVSPGAVLSGNRRRGPAAKPRPSLDARCACCRLEFASPSLRKAPLSQLATGALPVGGDAIMGFWKSCRFLGHGLIVLTAVNPNVIRR